MGSNAVYEVSLELEPLRGSRYFGECAGVFVVVFLAAGSLREALDSAEAWAEDSSYAVLDLDHCLRIYPENYTPHGDGYPTAAELSELLTSQEVLTGVFHVYEAREEH